MLFVVIDTAAAACVAFVWTTVQAVVLSGDYLKIAEQILCIFGAIFC